MIKFSTVNVFEQGYFNGLYIFVGVLMVRSIGKVLVSGQNVYICRTGSELRRMPGKLVGLMQYGKFKKYGNVHF